ncbi:unnamed protein product, partial [Ectocarpus sp. 4 AP-2014]
PQEATCDVECAMKVEEIRIMSKKRKQSQRVGAGNVALASKGGANNSAKAAKRPLSNSNGCGAGMRSAKGGGGGGGGSLPSPADQLSVASAGAAAPNLSKASSASAAGGGGGGGGKDSKDAASRRRFVWSVPLHQDFVAAVFDVGLKCASPKLLLEMMPVVDGLTSEHIKSHLQKYRLHRQRSREEFLKSYNYLTDLDGGKSLGGGSAAATVAKAAAAAAGGGGDVEEFSPGRGRDADTPGCGSSCDCVDTSNISGGSGIGGGSSSLAEADGRGEAARSKSTTGFAQTVNGDEGAVGSGGGAKASAQLAGGGTEAVGGAQRLQLPGEAAAGEVVNGALLLSHLELLAKGIDMQVKFHNHLREVVESQQQLQAQLVRQQGREHLPKHPAEFSGGGGGGGGRMPRAFPSSAAATTTATAASAVGVCPPSDLQYAGSIVGAEGNNQVPKEVHLVGGGCGSVVSTAGYSSTLSDSSSLLWSGGGEDKLAGSPKEAEQGGRGAAAADRPRRKERPRALNHAGASQLEAAVAADASMDSARAAASKARQSVGDHMHGDGTGEHLGDAQQQKQFDPAEMRKAFSVQAGAGRVAPLHSQGLSGRQGAGLAAPRGYVPGDYTLTPKAPEDGGAGRVAQHARGQPAVLGAELLAGEGALGAHKSIFAARSPAEARAALTAAALAPVTSTGNASNGQETLTLQRHMQAQMSMQQSMLSACNDQATNFGQRGWCGGERPAAAAAAVATPAFGEAGGGALCGGGGVGKEGGGNGYGAGADLGNNKEQQRLDSLSLQPSDAGDPSAMMGLLHQDDMFDFGMLDREGELRSAPGDSTPPGPAVARPNGDEHSTLFSFLMD